MPGSTLKAMPAAQRLVVAGDEVRLLVALEPDPVAGPMDERLAVALGVDDVARGRVDRLAGDARADGRVAAAWARCRTAKRWRNSSSGPFAASPPVTHSVRVMSQP